MYGIAPNSLDVISNVVCEQVTCCKFTPRCGLQAGHAQNKAKVLDLTRFTDHVVNLSFHVIVVFSRHFWTIPTIYEHMDLYCIILSVIWSNVALKHEIQLKDEVLVRQLEEKI